MKKVGIFFLVLIASLSMSSTSISAKEENEILESKYKKDLIKDTFFKKATDLLSPDLKDYIESGNDENVILSIIIDEFDSSKVKSKLSSYENYFDINGLLKDNLSKEEIRISKKIANDERKNQQTKINNKFVSKLDIEFTEIFIAKYSPFIVISVDVDDVNYLANLKEVKYIDIITQIYQPEFGGGDLTELCNGSDCDGGVPPSPTQNEINNDVIDQDLMIGAFDGSGIKIGILDEGIVDVDHLGFNNTPIVRDEPDYYEDVEPHSTQVALVAAGVNGVAPGAQIYSAEFSSYNGLSDEMEWFMDNEVNLINISLSIGGHCEIGYNDTSQYMDYMVFQFDLTITKASGNNKCSTDPHDDTYEITVPGESNNVITVGGSGNDNDEMYEHSSYAESFSTSAEKPILVAPAYWTFDIWGVQDGTSFSAPCVAGAIALLWEKYSFLESSPDLTTSMLMAGADRDAISDRGLFTSSGLYEKAGAGLLNIYNSSQVSYSRLQTDGTTGTYTYRVYLDPGESCVAAAVWQSYAASWFILPITDYDIEVYRSDGYLAAIANSIHSNTEIAQFTNTTSVVTYFDIKIVIQSYAPFPIEYVNISILH